MSSGFVTFVLQSNWGWFQELNVTKLSKGLTDFTLYLGHESIPCHTNVFAPHLSRLEAVLARCHEHGPWWPGADGTGLQQLGNASPIYIHEVVH